MTRLRPGAFRFDTISFPDLGAKTMTQFHEGQEVEVTKGFDGNPLGWRKAKIVQIIWLDVIKHREHKFEVEFPDGTGAVFDTAHIRECEQ